jgi:hypothetical protein
MTWFKYYQKFYLYILSLNERKYLIPPLEVSLNKPLVHVHSCIRSTSTCIYTYSYMYVMCEYFNATAEVGIVATVWLYVLL